MIITINDTKCECSRGETLLHIARRNGIFIPTLCNHEGLGALGACRLCIVEVVFNGQSQVVASCLYPVEREVEVFTDSDMIKEERGVILALLARMAPNSTTIQQMAAFGGAEMPRLANKEGGDTCILCGRCAAACELVGSGAISKINRGAYKAIGAPYDSPSPECIGCAGCAHVCPTGSIPFSETETAVTIWGRTFDLKRCPCCGRPVSTDEMIANARLREAVRETGAIGASGASGANAPADTPADASTDAHTSASTDAPADTPASIPLYGTAFCTAGRETGASGANGMAGIPANAPAGVPIDDTALCTACRKLAVAEKVRAGMRIRLSINQW